MKDNTKARFKLRSIFLFVNLTVLFLPLFGVIFFRFYENQLVKQTESELISQAAVLSAIYKEQLKDELGPQYISYGLPLGNSNAALASAEEYFKPISPQADLFSDDILPPRPDGVRTTPQTPPGESEQQPLLEVPEIDSTLATDLNLNDILSSPEHSQSGSTHDDTQERGRTVMDASSLPPTVRQENFGIEIIENTVARRVGAQMLPIIVDAQKTTLSGIKILDYMGVAVAGRNEVGLNFSLLAEIDGALKGNYTSLIRERISDEPPPALASLSRGTGVRLFVAFPIIENERLWGVVYLSRTPQNILKHIYDNKENMALIGLSLLGVTLLLALLTSYTVSKPLYRLIDRVKRFTDGEQQAIEPMTSPGIKEIELLSESFSNMAFSLNNRAHYIREFAMSVSHEFKTPITSIQGSAELLLEHIDDMAADKKQKFLSNIIMDSDRLKRLINRLLDLAKADNIKPGKEQSSLINSFHALKERYNDLNLNIIFDSLDDCTVSMGRETLETILINIFDNAMQNGASEIQISGEEKFGFITLEFQDNGNGISEANRDKIFDSFFTTKRESGGTGLGLGIVNSLLGAHNGSIKLLESKKGACFEIMLPIYIEQAE